MTKEPEQTAEELTGVRAKLASAGKSGGGTTKELPISDVTVSIPGFIDHGAWMLAQRQAKGDVPTAQAAFIAQVVLFEGEKLTLADIRELCDARDVMFLVAQIFGDGDDEGDEGNGGTG